MRRESDWATVAVAVRMNSRETDVSAGGERNFCPQECSRT
jgi:hypothetical protein